MIFELVYTSAPQGLFSGNTGFSVVACTRNMDYAICKQLENLSAYTPYYPHYDSNALNNPVNYAHRIINVTGKEYHILSRICFNGLDYTQRSNKLASHIAISSDELNNMPCGPADVFFQESLFKDEHWKIETGYFENSPIIINQKNKFDVCRNWQQVCGDAGWAGTIAESYLANPQKNIYVVFDPQNAKNNLDLISEILSLLPESLRWQVTFSTYFTELPAGVTCNIRFCLPTCEALIRARQNPQGNFIVDLTTSMPPAVGGELVIAARTGKLPVAQVTHAAPIMPYPAVSVPVVSKIDTAEVGKTSKIISIISVIAFVVLGLFFLIIKILDNNKLKNFRAELEKNKVELTESCQSLSKFIRYRIEDMRSHHYKMPAISNSVNLQNEVANFLKSVSKPQKNIKKQKKNAKALSYYKELDKSIFMQNKILSKLNEIHNFYLAEKDLVDEIEKHKEHIALSDASKNASLAYLPQIDFDMINSMSKLVQNDIKRSTQLKKELVAAFPNAKFSAGKKISKPSNGDKILTSDQLWIENEELCSALNKKNKYEIIISNLIPEAKIKKVYWGKNALDKKSENHYSISINGKSIDFDITLSNKRISIRRIDKNTIKLSKPEISIQITDKSLANNQWLNFFFDSETKLPLGESVIFSVLDYKCHFQLPFPQKIKKLPRFISSLNVVMVMGATRSPKMKVDQKGWSTTISMEFPQEIQLLKNLSNVKSALLDNIRNNRFMPEMEDLVAFDEYNKSKKTATDMQKLIQEIEKRVSMDKLGVSLNKIPLKYRKLNLKDAENSIVNDIIKTLNKNFGQNTKIILKSTELNWKQEISIKRFTGDR